MKGQRQEYLARHCKLTFRRMKTGVELIQRFHALREMAQRYAAPAAQNHEPARWRLQE